MTDVQPQAPEAEEAVLGACLFSDTALDTASEELTSNDFYRPSHGRMFAGMLQLQQKGEPIDEVTLTTILGEDLKTDVYALAALRLPTANVAHHARIVKACSTARGLIRAGGEVAKLGWEQASDGADRAEQIVYELAQQRSAADFESGIAKHLQVLTRLRENEQELIGTASGYPALDNLTQGFVPGNLIVVAARPSMGKSALALNIALRLIGREIPVGLWTMEMSKPEITQRLLSVAAAVPGEHVKNPRKASPEEWKRILERGGELDRAPLYVSEQGTFSPQEIRSQMRRLHSKVPLGLAIVDYIGLMHADAENRTQEVTKITQTLKATARDLNVPIMALAQLNRNLEQRTDKRPILSDLRESGSVEQDADLVIFLYRDDYYNENSQERGWVELHLAKHRNGPTDRVRLVWKREFAQFSNPALGLVDVAA